MTKREPRPATLPATLIDPQEAAIKQDALNRLKAFRDAAGGDDPFTESAMHAALQQMAKEIADRGEGNAALLVEAAVAGTEDAHDALVELINERNVRGETLGPALTSYGKILSHSGPPPVRPPEGRTRENFLADQVVVRLLIYLQRRYGLKLRRSSSRRPSACSIAADVLREAGVGRGGEERVRKIWERYGPPAISKYREQAPPPGVVRFTSE